MTFNGVVVDCNPGTVGPNGLARCRKESVSVMIGGEMKERIDLDVVFEIGDNLSVQLWEGSGFVPIT